jgi:hypothetical protein
VAVRSSAASRAGQRCSTARTGEHGPASTGSLCVGAVTRLALDLPLARRIIVDGLFASTPDPHAYAYRTTQSGFYLAPKQIVGRVHDYRYEAADETFFVFDALGDPIGRVYLKDDEWIAGMDGVGELPFHFGGARLLLATLSAN